MAKRKRPSGSAPSAAVASYGTAAEHPPSLPEDGVVAPAPKPLRRKSSRGGTTGSARLNDEEISAVRASPHSGDSDKDSAVSKLRVDNVDSAELHTKTPLARNNTNTEALANGQGQPRKDGSGRGARPGGSANAGASAPGAPSADLTPQTGGKKRKQSPTQHVKVNSAMPDDASGTAIFQDAPPADDVVKVEQDVGVTGDPENEEGPKDDEDEEEAVKEALSRPPPVNSDYLPLPWKGRLGYACLNTYLRNANPPVFSSRTCRIASILEHRHPLKDPSQAEHATKNRPDKEQPADIERGQRYVEELGLANARDIIKMVRWNDKYGIKFMRLSSEMFPFASHLEYGYKLEPFAAETLAEVGKVVAELGHRVTTHPGQYTQLGSPRKEVITAAIRDLDYHEEMLSLLKLPPQQDRDAVMILHLGGVFGDKAATLDRFRENYAKLSDSVKRRLVLENDDVSWSVHELLPVCQELNIPMVLDFHHHNIVFDSTKLREGTKDIMELYPAILETWSKKGITPKMHYSEPCPDAVTARSRRKHSPRVMTLPSCPDTMDLMIEAKDKEQAVFQLMRTFKLPGFDLFNDVVPHVRLDENKPWKPKPKKPVKKGKKKKTDDLDALEEKIEDAEEEEKAPPLIPEEEVGMGGPLRQVFWPVGQEHWLRPPKRVIKKKEEGAATPAKKKRKTAATADDDASLNGEIDDDEEDVKTPAKKKPPPKKKATASAKRKAATKSVPTPSPSDDEDSSPLSDLGEDDDDLPVVKSKKGSAPTPVRNRSGRASRVSYKEEDADE